LREGAVADHVREHNRGEFAMFGAGLRHCSETLCTSLPERSLKAKASPGQPSYAPAMGANQEDNEILPLSEAALQPLEP
jgi:hypothetical protein